MKLTVVIPCRNEVRHIEKCLEHIYANSFVNESNTEVLVIDGQSDDGTVQLLDQLKDKYPGLKVIENERRITPVAFNMGITHAKGEYIQIIGARQFVSANYFGDSIEKLESSPEIWCLGGAVENHFEDDTSRIISTAMNSSFGVGMGNFRIATESVFVDTVGTPMYPKWVFDKIGLFDESLVRNQDDELNYRVTSAGGKILLFADVKISYVVRASFNKLFKQYRQYGYWKVMVNKKHKAVTNLRQLFPMFFLLFLISSPAWFFIGSGFFPAVILSLYLLLGSFFAVKSALRISESPKILYTYFILHFSYGLGYLEGMIDVFIRRRQPSAKQQTLSR